MRSGIEIGRLLHGICDSGVPCRHRSIPAALLCFATTENRSPSWLLLIACSDVKGKAAEAVHEGVPATRLVFPPAVLALRRCGGLATYYSTLMFALRMMLA
jgi:hypothetical protein